MLQRRPLLGRPLPLQLRSKDTQPMYTASASSSSAASGRRRGRRAGTAIQSFAILTALLLGAPGAKNLMAADECAFLTNEEIEKITGRELLFKLRSMPLPDGGVVCDSNIARVVVLSGENSEGRLADMMKGAGREQTEQVPLTGLGQSAYALNLDPRAENEYATALVVATSGQYTAAVSIRAKPGEPAASAQPQAIELAKIVVSRLQ